KLEIKVLTLELRVSNHKAKKLYKKIGFKEKSIRKNYYSDNNEDALKMAYRIEKEDEDKEK
ncbi:MAG: ribosomal-protein-alanine N-acetyltransferase, partial [Atopostipes suicloacalis]|nr:ribosomal-protein-alanine N-acetyltransferase [Atopostipes suicloacalis]